jgi:hypothetical protein
MEPERPNIQIDDLVRPMTDDEYAVWLEEQTNYVPLPGMVTDGD